MNPKSISAVYNKNGILTIYVLMDDGTILKKAEDEQRWSEIDTVSGHRNEQPTQPDLSSKKQVNKRTKKN